MGCAGHVRSTREINKSCSRARRTSLVIWAENIKIDHKEIGHEKGAEYL
jgi:hypothetical protein